MPNRRRRCGNILTLKFVFPSILLIFTANIGAQDESTAPSSPAGAATGPIRAVPAAPTSFRNSQTGLPPQSGPAAFRNPDPIITGDEVKLKGGATMGRNITGSRVIEDGPSAERVQVFPDDPDSAWWEINPSYAFARAQREQKPLMVVFTAMWNTQAMALSQEVFSTKSFNEYVKENLVICYIPYPRNITDLPRQSPARMIKEKFKIKGYPNVLLFTPDGEVHRGMTGYRSGRPVDYFDELRTACIPLHNSIKSQKEIMEKQGFRDWSNFMRKVIFAKFVRRDETHVALRDVSGQIWTIPINDLYPDDQKLVESFPPGKKVLIETADTAPEAN